MTDPMIDLNTYPVTENKTRRLCTICARGGSQGVKNKNLRDFGGKPLIVHSIDRARASGCFDYIGVSSDSDEILAVAEAAGIDLAIKRPDELATHTAGKVDAILHAVKACESAAGVEYDTLVDLDCTSPLRLESDIRNAIAILERNKIRSVITGATARRSPYFNLVELQTDGTVAVSKRPEKPILRRQDAPKTFDMNASIYVWQRDAFLTDPRVFYDDTRLLVMPEWRSIDIDHEIDFMLNEQILASGKYKEDESFEAAL